MGDADLDTPQSHGDPPLLKAAKDKNCPFCGQAFTSSSLGRHLDLYIRPKNPKAPDGVHVVDEIRKLRGGITRRQAKGSVSRRREDSPGANTPAHAQHSAGSAGSSTLVPSPEADADDDDDGGRPPFQEVGWGRSARQLSARLGAHEQRRDAHRQLRRHEREQRGGGGERETADAAVLALRELLRSVRDANLRATGGGLFDLDPYALSFPALCLHVLPAPPTLFSAQPFATAESWSVAPPAQKQLDALNRAVRERLLARQRQRHLDQLYPPAAPPPEPAAAAPLPTPPLCDPDPQKLFNHIADAYNHWQHQPEPARHELWQLEILRCYARAVDARRDADQRLEAAHREIERLHAASPAARPPVSIALGADTARELATQGMDFRNWDFDRLVDKWRAAVRDPRPGVGMAAQKPLPDPRPGHSSPLKMDAALPFSAPATVTGEPDHLDAEGDSDTDSLALDPDAKYAPRPSLSLAPRHSIPHQPTPLPHQPSPIHPAPLHAMHAPLLSQPPSQAALHAHAQAQAQAQAHAWAAARHMDHARAQAYSPHHAHMSPHPNPQHPHMASASNSRRPSVMMDANVLPNGMAPMGLASLDGIDPHADPFMRLDCGPMAGFVGAHDGAEMGA